MTPARLHRLCRSKAYLFRGVELRWSCDPSLIKDETPAQAVLHFPGGLTDFLASAIEGRGAVELLEQGDILGALAEALGHDTFLIVETLYLRGVLRRAAAVSWPRAQLWLQRQQDLLAAAQLARAEGRRPLVLLDSAEFAAGDSAPR